MLRATAVARDSPGVFINNGQNLNRPSNLRPICHKIIGANMVSLRGSEPRTEDISEPQPSALGLVLGNLQALPATHPFEAAPLSVGIRTAHTGQPG